MKYITLITLIIAALFSSVNAQNKDAKFKIAEINFNEIYSAIGSTKLRMIDVSPEIKAELIKLRDKQDQLLVEVLKEDDEIKLASLQGAQQAIQTKIQMIYNILSRSNSSSDYRYQIRKFVSENYCDEFQIIIDSNTNYNSSNQLIISPDVSKHDITKRVIADIEKTLP